MKRITLAALLAPLLFFGVLVGVCFFSVPHVALAHEVYVLDHDEIAHDVAQPPLNLFAVVQNNEHQFLLAAFLGIIVVVCILGISLSHGVERLVDPILMRIKPYAAHIAQITFGGALFASAHYGALFGIELPLATLFGVHAFLVTIALYIASITVLLGLYPRVGAFLAFIIYIGAVKSTGLYMVSYGTYLGESLVILFFGGGYAFLSTWIGSPIRIHMSNTLARVHAYCDKRKHFFMRIFFGISLMYAALYAKLIHGQLALNTVLKYHLTNYFPFDPLFIVLGAFLIEMTIALFYLLGFEIRFTSLFFLTFLTMSLLFFGEAVWPHIILIGTAISLFVHGYDDYTIERKWYVAGKREPVL